MNVALCGISAGGGSAGHILQRWSAKWSEFVDVTSSDQIKSKDKLRVVPKSTVSVL